MEKRIRAKYLDIKNKDFKLDELFESSNGDFDIQAKHLNNKGELVVSSGDTNSGIIGRTDIKAKIFSSNTITVDMFGGVYYRNHSYKLVTHARVFSLAYKGKTLSEGEGLYLTTQLFYLKEKYNYSNMASWNKIKDERITLPTHADGTIAFDYMEAYVKEFEAERIKELETYLMAAGLNDYVLTEAEEKVLADFRKGNVTWGEFRIGQVFDHVVQGRRLKKHDQTNGKLPFVMSGNTNTGVAGYIGNNVKRFPGNSITVDIFGSAFYRDYEYGMGDDTGAYWNERISVSKYSMMFVTSIINKTLFGKYDYGHKLRSSRAKGLTIKLPINATNQLDYAKMDLYIKAIQKLVIKGVVQWKDQQIETTKHIVGDQK